MTRAKTPAPDDARLPLVNVLTYSAAALPVAALTIAVLVYLPPYFAGHLAVPAALIGTVWMAIRLIDIPVDVGLALAIDATRTPIGRYRVWMILGAPLLSLALYKLFMAPHGFGAGFLVFWLLTLYLAWSIVSLAGSAWGATLATRYDERSRLFGIQTAMGVGATLLVLLIPILGRQVHADDAASIRAMGWFLVVLAPLAIGVTVAFTPERTARDRRPAIRGLALREIWFVLSKPDLLRLFLAQVCLTLGPGWMSGLYIFFFTQQHGYTVQEASLLLALYVVAGVPGALGAAALSRRISKHRTLVLATTGFSLGLFSILIVPKGDVLAAMAPMLWLGAMAASFGLMIQAMLADVGDEVRLRQGRERISLIYALNGLAQKIAAALSIGVSYPLLAAIGFRPAEGAVNSPAAIDHLTWAFIAGPIVFVMLGGACVLGWRLDARRQAEIRQALEAPRGETTSPAAGLPPLVGGLDDDARQVEREKGRRQEGFFRAIPRRAFEEPVIAGRTLIWNYVLVSDPAGVRRVLVENAANYPKTRMDLAFFAALFGGGLLGLEGEDWRRHRRIMAPAFDPRSVGAYGPAMASTVQAFLERWDVLPDAAPIDMAAEMTLLTLEVISRTVFSADGMELMGMIRQMLLRGMQAAAAANILDLLPVIGPWRMASRAKALAKAAEPLDAAIEALLERRRALGAEGPVDLISRLLAARDAETGGRLTGKEIRDEIVTIYLAGHETTASTLSWTWYVLAQRPAHLALMQAEIDEALGSRPPSPDDLPRLGGVRRVVEEAMRLYPAAPSLSTRRALADDEVCGVRVRKGAAVNILPWVLHRHRRLWDDPEAFDPDRFSAERSADRPRFAYLPFGAGPRVCIGQVLAMNEAILALAALAQRYSARLAPGAQVTPSANVTLQFRHGLPMILERRRRQAPAAGPREAAPLSASG
jgi:cytochrome P450/Na+/melibiose symporter-like transporter